MSVVGIIMGLSVTISKEFKNGFKLDVEFTGKDLIEMFIVMTCLAGTGVCGSRSRQNEHLTNHTMK